MSETVNPTDIPQVDQIATFSLVIEKNW